MAIALTFAIICCVVTAIAFNVPDTEFVSHVKFGPLIYIISMNIVVILLTENVVFNYLAEKTIQITNGSPRAFFYIICTLSMFTSGVMEDVSAAIIYIPLVIQSCRILKIRPEPYIFGIAICLNIGDMLAPFSNSQNLLVANAFNVDIAWFGAFVDPYLVLSHILTLVIIDFTQVRKFPKATEEQLETLKSSIDPSGLIEKNPGFKKNVVAFICVIVAFFIIEQAYLVAAIAGVVFCIINRKSYLSMLRQVDWTIVGIFISLFLMVGCMIINGSMTVLATFFVANIGENPFIAAVIVLLISSVITWFMAPGPTTLFFVPMMSMTFASVPALAANPDLMVAAFVFGINLGGNVLPVGAPCFIQTLNIVEEQGLETIKYKDMVKVGAKFSLYHVLLAIVYLWVYALILGVL